MKYKTHAQDSGPETAETYPVTWNKFLKHPTYFRVCQVEIVTT